MKSFRSVYCKVALTALAVLGFAGAAQATGNVYWSVGVESPGIAVGVSNARPVYVQPAPVYYQPQPVYYQPQPVYYQPAPVYVQPRPIYIQPRPVYVQPEPVYYGRSHGWHKRHGHHGRDYDDDDRRGGHRKGGHFVQSHSSQPYVHGPRGFQPPGYYYGR